MSAKAAVLMATYNGEKYIRYQLDSIIDQTFKDWELYISDDGSTDNTLNILKEYQERDPRIVLIDKNEWRHGASLNYYSILEKMKTKKKYDYYFICDQDNILKPNKFENEIDFINSCSDKYGDICLLCYGDMDIIDGNGDDKHLKQSDTNIIALENPYDIFFSHTYAYGCAMVFNYKLLETLIIPKDISNNIVFDVYLTMVAALYGKVVYNDMSLILYRIHDSNATTMNMSDKSSKQYLKILVKKYNTFIDAFSHTATQAMYFTMAIKDPKNEFAKDYQLAYHKSGINALKLWRKYKLMKDKNLAVRFGKEMIFILGLYKRSDYYKKMCRYIKRDIKNFYEVI